MWRQRGSHVSSLPSNVLLPLRLPQHFPFPIYCLLQCSGGKLAWVIAPILQMLFKGNKRSVQGHTAGWAHERLP